MFEFYPWQLTHVKDEACDNRSFIPSDFSVVDRQDTQLVVLLTTTAANSERYAATRDCCFIYSRKSMVHKPSAPKLGEMFTQVVDTLFHQVLESRDLWMLNGNQPQTPPIFKYNKNLVEPPSLSIDYKALKQRALEEFSGHESLIFEILPEQLGSRVGAMFKEKILRMSAAAWSQIVCAFLGAYASASDRDRQLRIVEALKPLYFARVVFFIRETLELDHVGSEEKLVQQAQTFWRHRRRLLEGHLAVA